MATQFLSTSSIRRFAFTRYLTSIATFQTAYQADIPALATTQALFTSAAPTVAIIITPNNGPVLSVNLNDYLGFNYGVWQVVPTASMGRLVADGATTNASPTVTSATAAFAAGDLGGVVATTNLPVGATIITVNSATSVVMSANATATGSSQSFTITPSTSLFTPDIV